MASLEDGQGHTFVSGVHIKHLCELDVYTPARGATYGKKKMLKIVCMHQMPLKFLVNRDGLRSKFEG